MGRAFPRKVLRLVGFTVLGVITFALLAALALPLVYRGERLARVVMRATAPTCGQIRIAGGSVGITAVLDYLLGRSVAVSLDGLEVAGAHGERVVTAARLTARARVSLRPLSLTFTNVHVSGGSLAIEESHDDGHIGLIEVFRIVPAGATREQCFHRDGSRSPTASAASPASRAKTAMRPRMLAVVVGDVTLENVTVSFDFADWGLTLARTNARGEMRVAGGGSTGTALTFDVRDVRASGGRLRIGRREQRWAARIEFADVTVDRVATADAAPADLLIQVRHGVTGRSVLRGKALFTNVFAWGPRGGKPGLDLDARWEHFGDVLDSLKTGWGLTWPQPGAIDGVLTARVAGPLARLEGALRAETEHASVVLTWEPDRRSHLAAQFDGWLTTAGLHRSLAPLLGGKLTGQIEARGQMADHPLEISADVVRADLLLARTRRGPFPRWFRLVVGPTVPRSALEDELAMGIDRARFAHGAVDLGGLRGSFFGARITGDARVAFFDPRTGGVLAVPRLDGQALTQRLSLERTFRDGPLRGHVSFRLAARGATDDLRVQAQFLSPRSFWLWDQPFLLPPVATAEILAGDELVVSSFGLRHRDSGTIEAQGRLVLDGRLDARLAIRGYSLLHLPRLSRAGLPLGGQMDGALKIAGSLRAFQGFGRLALSDVSFVGERLGSGRLTLTAIPSGSLIQGTVADGLVLAARLTVQPRASFAGALTFVDLPVGRFLPPAARGFPLAASGRLSFDFPSQAGLALALRGGGVDVDAQGSYRTGTLASQLRGTIDLGVLALRRLAPPVGELAGRLVLDLDLSGPADRTLLSRLRGKVRIAEPVRVRPQGWPVVLKLPWGTATITDEEIRTDGLPVELDHGRFDVAGGLRIDRQAFRATAVDLSFAGAVEAAPLAKLSWVKKASGGARMEARISGTLGAPVVSGRAELRDLALTLRGSPVGVRRVTGTIDAQGNRLTTENLSISVEPKGQVWVGTPSTPATARLIALSPLALGAATIPIRGTDLALGGSIRGLLVHDADFNVLFSQEAAGDARIAGDVRLDAATYTGRDDLEQLSLSLLSNETRPIRQLRASTVSLDLRLKSGAAGLVVPVPYLPDPKLGFDCQLSGTLRRPKSSGHVRGDGLYSRVLFYLYDVFGGTRLRKCEEP